MPDLEYIIFYMWRVISESERERERKNIGIYLRL